ncbi:MAG: ribokinase [Desulfobulbus propionicus]|nr:MAG: ribokinase [Desulfobulbus propionicus]
MIYNGVFFGLTTVDIVHYVPHFPAANGKVKSERTLTYAGGPATNAAVTFAALGNTASLITGIGGRYIGGNYLKEDLKQWGVDVFDCTDQPERPSVMASVIVDLSNGNRTVIYSNTDNRRLKSEASGDAMLENKDILMLDGHYMNQAVRIAEKAHALGIPIVLDGGSWKEGEEKLLPLVDYMICSADFAPPGCTSMEETTAFLRNHGCEKIAFTKGAHPIVVIDNQEQTEIPVMNIKPIDTMGAGDILHGAFCHFILEHDYHTSLARAAEIASQSCTSLGPRSWIEQEIII